MKVGKTLYAKNRKGWRAWLAKNHKNASEIWLIYYKKDSGKPRIAYNDAVEETSGASQPHTNAFALAGSTLRATGVQPSSSGCVISSR